jgi:hypothetical protein
VRVEDYAPMTHSIAGFEHPMLDRSVGSGAASDSAARVWCRAPKPGPYCVVYYSVQRPSRRRVVKFDARKGASDLVSVVELREGIATSGLATADSRLRWLGTRKHRQAQWKNVREGASEAFCTYSASRALSLKDPAHASFYHGFR